MAYAALGLGAMGLLYPAGAGLCHELAARSGVRAEDLRRRVRGSGRALVCCSPAGSASPW